MSEEEKQAIECLKHSLYEYEEINTSVMEYIDKNHKIIYKLILKQQKEIEKRLKEIDSLYNMMSARDEKIDNLMEMINRYNDMQYIRKIEELYISKDKIRKIREKYRNDYMTININNRSAGKTFKQAVNYEVRKVIDEMLGE